MNESQKQARADQRASELRNFIRNLLRGFGEGATNPPPGEWSGVSRTQWVDEHLRGGWELWRQQRFFQDSRWHVEYFSAWKFLLDDPQLAPYAGHRAQDMDFRVAQVVGGMDIGTYSRFGRMMAYAGAADAALDYPGWIAFEMVAPDGSPIAPFRPHYWTHDHEIKYIEPRAWQRDLLKPPPAEEDLELDGTRTPQGDDPDSVPDRDPDPQPQAEDVPPDADDTSARDKAIDIADLAASGKLWHDGGVTSHGRRVLATLLWPVVKFYRKFMGSDR